MGDRYEEGYAQAIADVIGLLEQRGHGPQCHYIELMHRDHLEDLRRQSAGICPREGHAPGPAPISDIQRERTRRVAEGMLELISTPTRGDNGVTPPVSRGTTTRVGVGVVRLARKALWWLPALLLGCAAQVDAEGPWPRKGRALVAGEALGFDVSGCAEQPLDQRPVGAEDFQRLCGDVEGATRGCFRAPDLVVYLDQANSSRRVLAHELGHWLYYCAGIGGGNDDHSHPLWQDALSIIRGERDG